MFFVLYIDYSTDEMIYQPFIGVGIKKRAKKLPVRFAQAVLIFCS